MQFGRANVNENPAVKEITVTGEVVTENSGNIDFTPFFTNFTKLAIMEMACNTKSDFIYCTKIYTLEYPQHHNGLASDFYLFKKIPRDTIRSTALVM